MKVTKRIKCMSEARKRRYRHLVGRIARTNDTALSDDVVLAILKAKNGPWSEPTTAEELLASMGLDAQLPTCKGSLNVSAQSWTSLL